jgi:putative FmdB family regulatory protein
MLIFDYICCNCGKQFEKIVDKSDEFVYCPKCCYITKKIFHTKMSFKLNGDCWAKDGYTKKEKTWEKHMEY